MIKAVNISQRTYIDNGSIALPRQLNFQIESGEFVAFIADDEMEKSMLIKTLGLLSPLVDGELYISDVEVSKLSDIQKSDFRTRNIGILFRDVLLIDELTVFENVELPLIYLKVDKNTRKSRVDKALAQMNLSHRKNHYPGNLQQELLKQVELARAIVIQPKIILVEEPSYNISVTGFENLMKNLLEINELGITIVITSNEFDADRFVHRSLYLDNKEVFK